jgi:hypothetical protein
MLSNSLVTNEIKKSDGTEVEFTRQSSNNRTTVFNTVIVDPARPHNLTISHQETGTGLKRRRRSLVRFDKTVTSGVDDVTPITVSAYAVLDFPIGASESTAEAANVLAELWSFCASLGASTTILYDGTGNGSVAMLNGSL